MTYPQIAEQLRERRLALHITQNDLAEMSDVSLRTIKAVENGSGNPSVVLLQKLLEPLGLAITITERVIHE